MLLDLRPVIELHGGKVPFEFRLDLSDLEINFHHPAARPVEVRGEVVNNFGSLELHASASTVLDLVCDRCISRFDEEWRLDIHEKLLRGPALEYMDDIFTVTDGFVDVEKVVRTAFILDMKLKWLCGEDCRGICHICGVNLNENCCDCGVGAIDPRLSILGAMLPPIK